MKKLSIRTLVKRAAGTVLALALTVGMMAEITVPASAANVSVAPSVSYDCSSEVETGTIRYVSQTKSSGYFHPSYWGSWVNGGPNSAGPGGECCTCTISMALSYVGINKTPEVILGTNNGITYFTGWGADFLSVSISDGLNQMASGEGKYSPVMLHFRAGAPGYDSNYGHWVLAIAQSGNDYTILDPANDNIWTLTPSDYRYSYIAETYQFHNANAILKKAPAALPSNVLPTRMKLEVTRKNGSVVRTGAGNKEAITGRLQQGTVVTAIGYIKNKYGNVWYYLEDGTYVFSGNVKIDGYQSTATISNVSAPSGNLAYGGIYVLKGNISSSCNTLVRVTATVKTTAGQVVLEASDKVSGQYSLQSSPIDKAMTFNTLPRGNYIYEIKVEESVDTGVACAPLHTVLYTSNFTIS